MDKVLILGGSGLVGTAVRREMSGDKRFEVYATYCHHPTAPDPERDQRLDVEDPESAERVIRAVRPDLVVSCLRGDFAEQLKTHAAIAACLKKYAGRLYFFSTTNVFDNDRRCPHTEADRPDSCTEYGRFKIACEQTLCAALGEDACILRLPQVWGKSSPRLSALMGALYNREEIAVYPHLFHNTNTDEMIAKQLCYIIDRGLTGIFHLAAADAVNHRTFYAELTAQLGFPDAKLREDEDEKGYFALASLRHHEFPERLRITNQMVIDHLTT